VRQNVVEGRVWSNSASGYLRSLVRLALGVISFRQLCSELSLEELGFYSLVWSFLGYGVLFDFGLGVAVQKRTAELTQRKDWRELGRIISTVMFCNYVCATIIVIAGWFSTEPLLRAIDVTPDNYSMFQRSWHIFLVGLGAMYPLQVFREVHQGQQRLAAADRLSIIGGILSFAWLTLALRMKWGLPLVLAGQTICLVGTGIVLLISALRVMPEVRLRIRDVSWPVLRSIARFSAHAYVAVIAGIIVLQTDRLLVGAVLSVSAVATYHIGAKIPELFSSFTLQLPEALAPAAATLHEQGRREHWQQFFLRGIRINALVTTPLFILCNLFLEPLLGILTRGRTMSPDIILLGRILLVWSYSTILTHGVSKAVLLMSGREFKLVRLLALEAILNIGFSLLLLTWLGNPIGVALGSLVPALLIGWFFLWPWAAREIGMSTGMLFKSTLFPALRASGALCIFGFVWRFGLKMELGKGFVVFVIEALLAVIIGGIGTWRLGLDNAERSGIVTKIDTAWIRIRASRFWVSGNRI
jgi:O-antigen/teichoic acid export membrane protein